MYFIQQCKLLKKLTINFSIILFLQSNLALYCFANSQVTIALKLLYRARYLCLLVCGEDHPEIAILDVSLSLLYNFMSIKIDQWKIDFSLFLIFLCLEQYWANITFSGRI